MPEFFQQGQNLSFINLKGVSQNFNASENLIGGFKNLIDEIIRSVQQELSSGKDAFTIFQSKLPEILTVHEKQFQECIKGMHDEYTSIIAYFWKNWSENIGGLANMPLHSATYRARFTKLSDLTPFPNKFTIAVKESIEAALFQDKNIAKVMSLIEYKANLGPERKKLVLDVEKEKSKIEDSYFLKGNCYRIKEQ